MFILLVKLNCQVVLAEPVNFFGSLFDHFFSLMFLLYALFERTCSSYLQFSGAFMVHLMVFLTVLKFLRVRFISNLEREI